MNPYKPSDVCCKAPNGGNDFFSVCAAIALVIMCVAAFLQSINLIEFKKPWFIFDSPILAVIILCSVAFTAFYCGRTSREK